MEFKFTTEENETGCRVAKMEQYTPLYLKTLEQGQFPARVRKLKSLLKRCRVCPRNCAVNRLTDETGDCGIGRLPRVSSYFPHFGEEAPLVGWSGSGTIFMAGCNLLCVFCQNYEISHLREGRAVINERLARMMLELQDAGCHNINIVTPSHVVPQIAEALLLAAQKGLRLPLVYNTGAYDSLHTLRLLDGLVDIYMPDFKFYDDALAARYTGVKDYGTVARAAIKEMHRQVGDLVINERGIAVRGLLVRHLVMPGMTGDAGKIMKFLAEEISTKTYVNIMAQYRPVGEAHRYREIDRRPSSAEFAAVVKAARESGLQRLDKPTFGWW